MANSPASHVAAPIDQLPLGEERAVVELSSSCRRAGMLGDVDVGHGSAPP